MEDQPLITDLKDIIQGLNDQLERLGATGHPDANPVSRGEGMALGQVVSELEDIINRHSPEPTPLWNTMFDVAFEVIHEEEDPTKVPVSTLLEGMERRLNYLRNNPDDAAEAFGINETVIEIRPEEGLTFSAPYPFGGRVKPE